MRLSFKGSFMGVFLLKNDYNLTLKFFNNSVTLCQTQPVKHTLAIPIRL